MNTKYEGLFRTENLKSFKKMLNFLLLTQKTGRGRGIRTILPQNGYSGMGYNRQAGGGETIHPAFATTKDTH